MKRLALILTLFLAACAEEPEVATLLNEPVPAGSYPELLPMDEIAAIDGSIPADELAANKALAARGAALKARAAALSD